MDITPAPVTTVEELLAKMDLILGATKQWITDDDEDADELSLIILRRVVELSEDINVIPDGSAHWQVAGEKLMEIKEIFRQKSVSELEALYEGS